MLLYQFELTLWNTIFFIHTSLLCRWNPYVAWVLLYHIFDTKALVELNVQCSIHI